MKKAIIFGLVFLILFSGFIITYSILKKNNKYVKEWAAYPTEQKKLNIRLFLERPVYWLFTPTIDTSEIPVSKEKLKESVMAGANWIISMQEENGRYNYWYNPETAKYSSKHEDNFLRQAGTGYSLMLAFEAIGDSAFLKSALKNLDYLLKYKQEIDATKACFFYGQKAKLGGIALPMLTMLKYKEFSGDTIFDSDLKKLAETILLLQSKYKTGKFKSTYVYKGDYDYEKTSGWESDIYPGEAMLALTFMHKHFKDERYLESLNKALAFYSKKGRWRKSAFIPWTASAFSKLYEIVPDEKYAAFVFKMCNNTLLQQNLNKKRITSGSFGSVPSVFTSTSFEGIGDAVYLAQLTGNKNLEEKYIERSIIAYQWLLQLQYTRNDSVPEEAVGGFKRSLHQPEIRIDNTQHAISAMCRGLKYIY